MKKALLLLCLINVTKLLFAQFPDTKWVLGHSGGFAEQDSFGLTTLGFSNNQLQIGGELEIDYRMETNNISFSIEDSLLLYFNGRSIHNGNHQLIINGDDMYLGEGSLGYDVPQGALFLPLPASNDSVFYLINTHADWNDEIGGTTGAQLLYSIIHINSTSGLSEVILKNELLIQDALAAGQLTATRHANGRDWWIIWRYWDSNTFIRYLLSPNGLNRMSDQTIGEATPSGLGQAVFSPNGRRYVIFNTISSTIGIYINIYNFNRCTGLLSNQRIIQLPHEGGAGGAAISPNSRFLYIPSVLSIYQYDLWADDIEESRQIAATYDGFLSPYLPASFFMGQLARDGKIYISSPNGVMSLTTIDYPNKGGLESNVNQHAVRLPVRNSFGIPNFPNHRLGSIDGSECDTLGIDNIPLARFRSDQDTSNYLHFYFQNLSDYEPEAWFWTFGDGAISQDNSPVHTYQEDGIYEVCLTASNTNGSHTWCDTLNLGIVNTSEELTLDIQPQVFPNPFQNQFSLVLNDYYPQNVQLLVYDELGRRVHQQHIFHGWNTVDGGGWPEGLYFCELWEGNVIIVTDKVVKME